MTCITPMSRPRPTWGRLALRLVGLSAAFTFCLVAWTIVWLVAASVIEP
jgi:hypothetical protein